jgi:hypothetical protein
VLNSGSFCRSTVASRCCMGRMLSRSRMKLSPVAYCRHLCRQQMHAQLCFGVARLTHCLHHSTVLRSTVSDSRCQHTAHNPRALQMLCWTPPPAASAGNACACTTAWMRILPVALPCNCPSG